VRNLLRALLLLLPWRLRRPLLERLFGYRLHPGSRIGLAWVYPQRLEMDEGARIGHLSVCKGMALVRLGRCASIGRLNWISGYPTDQAPHFAHRTDRRPELLVGEHAAITNRHLIDCTDRVSIGRYTTIAGFRSQILTHSIDLAHNRQDARPVDIGEYCFTGTACTILGGSRLPDFSVLGAHSLLNKAHDRPHRLYGGVPARALAELDPQLAYFRRTTGFVT
jgi:carbonic anhydrase/acetyltransferase-like protein (isoleucine patch superfamily)